MRKNSNESIFVYQFSRKYIMQYSIISFLLTFNVFSDRLRGFFKQECFAVFKWIWAIVEYVVTYFHVPERRCT